MRLVIGAALALTAPAHAQPTRVQLAPGEALLSVEAVGESLSKPDVMTISAGAVATASTSQAAERANNVLVQQLVDVVRKSGIDARDVRTERLEVRPRFADGRNRNDDDPARVLGYVVRNTLIIRFRDLTRAAEIIESLFVAGANEVGGPSFSLADPTPARRAAERAALAEARAEAANYATALGKRLGRLVQVSDRRTEFSPYSNEIVVTGSAIGRIPIEPGELRTTATVFVDYALTD